MASYPRQTPLLAHGNRAGWYRALTTDVRLAGGVVAAGAALLGAGLGAGVAVWLLRGNVGWLLAGLGGGLLAGLLVAARTLDDRRHPAWARRARRRTIAATLLIAFVGLVAGSRGHTWLTGGGIALATAATALAGGWLGQWLTARGFTERHQAWQATLRASRLTRRMLGYDDYRRLKRDGALPVPSTLYPGRVYLVPLRTTPAGARILVLERERPIGGLCLRPREPLPDPEEALAHILAIRSDERAWLDRANFFPWDRALSPQARGLLPGRPGNYDR